MEISLQKKSTAFKNIQNVRTLIYFHGGPDPCELEFSNNRKIFYQEVRQCLARFAKSISPSVDLNLLKLVFQFYVLLDA
jgi:hypothetical protein